MQVHDLRQEPVEESADLLAIRRPRRWFLWAIDAVVVLPPVGVICELANDDGTVMAGPQT